MAMRAALGAAVGRTKFNLEVEPAPLNAWSSRHCGSHSSHPQSCGWPGTADFAELDESTDTQA